LDRTDRHRIADERDRLTRHLRHAEHTIATGPAERARIEHDIASARENLDHIAIEVDQIADTIRRYDKPALRRLHRDALSGARSEQPRLQGRQQATSAHLERLEQQLHEHDHHVADSQAALAGRHRIEARRDRYTEILDTDDTIQEVTMLPRAARGLTDDHTPSRTDGHGIEI
jgi:chromosome segregation ATPase